MKFSVFMMPIHQPSDNPSLAFERDISYIHLADELGFDEFFIGEHHSGGWENMPAPEMALAMAAVKAHRIRLGTSVTALPYHHPFHVAERIAFLDHLTRGRAILGVGRSSLVTDMKLFNLTPDKLYPMMNESIDVIVRLLESPDPISHDGEFWQFNDMRLQLRSYQQPRLPLAIATAGTPDSLVLAGRHSMILMSQAGRNLVKRYPLADQWTAVEAAAKKHGAVQSRDNWRLVTAMHLAETREQAWAEASEGLMRETDYFCTVGLKSHYEAYPDQPVSEFTPESCVDSRQWVVGTPDDAIAWIERKLQETGGFGGLMITAHEWTSSEQMRRSMEMFARYVMPHFRGHTTTFHDEWRVFQQQVAGGGVKLPDKDEPGNLVGG